MEYNKLIEVCSTIGAVREIGEVDRLAIVEAVSSVMRENVELHEDRARLETRIAAEEKRA